SSAGFLRGALLSRGHSTASAFLCHFEMTSLISLLPLRAPSVESPLALPVNSLHSRQRKNPRSHAHSAEQVHDQQDDHDQPDNPYSSARTPSPIPVIASAAPEQKHEDDNQQDQSHGNFLSATDSLRST